VEVNAADAAQRTEITAHWKVRWQLAEGLPFLSLTVADYEEVIHARDGAPMFEEVTEAVLGGTPHYLPLVRRGLDYWGQRISALNNLQYDGHNGIAVGDVNGDGRDDLYVCDNGGLANQLYIQQPDGTVKETAHEAGVNWLENTRSALLADLDNDGDQDLVIATISLVFFMENDGTGKFRQAGGVRGVDYPFSLTGADYDNDGLLDVYLCNYSARPDDASTSGGRLPTPYNDARNGGKNIMLRNLGGWRFADATEESGLNHNNDRWSFAAAWDDFDKDGDQDLYVANDFGRNNLYRNDGGEFTDIAAEAGVEDAATGMSAAWGDFNRDGNMDIYVGNMYSSAGNRITFQRKFTEARTKDAADMQRMARGNTLFAGDGRGGFKDVSGQNNILMGRWSWSSIFADLNNDGWQDIYVANGYLSNRKPDDL
jgi:FG-GAP-like repeat